MAHKQSWWSISLGLLAWQLLFTGPVQADPPRQAETSRPAFSGRITDEVGEPLAGVRVDISTAAPKVGRGIFCPSCYSDCAKWATTDESGQFEITDLDATLKFRLVIALPKFKTEHTDLLDPGSGAVNVQLRRLPTDIDPGRLVTGRAVSEQGTAIAGALISPYGARTAERRWWGQVDGVDSTVTDSEGNFVMIVPKDFQSLDIEIVAHGYAGKLVYELKPGAEPANIMVPTGATVVGKLTRHGVPVPNLSIAVAQTNRILSPDNGIFIAAVAAVTDIEGNFEFNNLPPSQQYCIYSVVGDAKRSAHDQVLTVKKFNVPGSGQRRDLGTLEVTDPISIRGRIESIDGKPLPPNLSVTFGRDPAWDLIAFPVGADGSFQAVGLPPETYEIRLGSRNLAIVTERLPFQALGEQAFGVHATEPITDLVIPVIGK